MTTASVIESIDTQVLKFAPIAIGAILAAEQSGADGPDKKKAVLAAITGGAQAGEKSSDSTVAGVSALIDVIVSVFNLTGTFQKAPAA